MVLKKLIIPEDITLMDGGKPVMGPNGKPVTVSFAQFADQITNDKKFGESLAGLKAAVALGRGAIGKQPGDWFCLLESEWEVVKAVLEAPGEPYVPVVAKQLYPFFAAVLDAVDAEGTLKT